MPSETIIVGDERGRFLYRSGNESRNVRGNTKYLSDAVALVFARDKEKSDGTYFCIYLCNIFIFLVFAIRTSIKFAKIHAFCFPRQSICHSFSTGSCPVGF